MHTFHRLNEHKLVIAYIYLTFTFKCSTVTNNINLSITKVGLSFGRNMWTTKDIKHIEPNFNEVFDVLSLLSNSASKLNTGQGNQVYHKGKYG